MGFLPKVSKMTVPNVYLRMDNEGLLVSHTRAGYFVSPTNSFNGRILRPYTLEKHLFAFDPQKLKNEFGVP